MAACDKTAQVHFDELRQSNVVADDRPHVGFLDPTSEEPYGREPEGFLVALGSGRGERPSDHAADVHHVRGHHHPGDQLVTEEDRTLHHHVLGMEAATIVGIVGHEDILWRDRLAVEGECGADGMRGGAEVELDHAGAHDQAPLGVEERARIVL